MHFFVKITSSRSFFCSYQRGKNSSPGGWLENWITHWPMETWPWTAIQFQWNAITQHQLLVLHHSTPPQHHPTSTRSTCSTLTGSLETNHQHGSSKTHRTHHPEASGPYYSAYTSQRGEGLLSLRHTRNPPCGHLHSRSNEATRAVHML